MLYKKCNKCLRDKQLKEFYVKSKYDSKRRTICKECDNLLRINRFKISYYLEVNN